MIAQPRLHQQPLDTWFTQERIFLEQIIFQICSMKPSIHYSRRTWKNSVPFWVSSCIFVSRERRLATSPTEKAEIELQNGSGVWFIRFFCWMRSLGRKYYCFCKKYSLFNARDSFGKFECNYQILFALNVEIKIDIMQCGGEEFIKGLCGHIWEYSVREEWSRVFPHYSIFKVMCEIGLPSFCLLSYKRKSSMDKYEYSFTCLPHSYLLKLLAGLFFRDCFMGLVQPQTDVPSFFAGSGTSYTASLHPFVWDYFPWKLLFNSFFL